MGQCIIMTGGYAGDNSDDCTAVKSQVLTGYKAITKDSDDDAVTGTMPERGAWTGSVGMNGSVIIPDGHHNGLGKVNGPSVTQRGTWTSGLGINGKVIIPEGYHNGQGYVNQSIATLGGQTITPSASQQTVACSGKYMTGNIVINPILNSFVELTTTDIIPELNKTSFLSGKIAIPGAKSNCDCLIIIYRDNRLWGTVFGRFPSTAVGTVYQVFNEGLVIAVTLRPNLEIEAGFIKKLITNSGAGEQVTIKYKCCAIPFAAKY